MAKRQNFVVGSTNAVTQTMTTGELNHGFDQYEILTADELDGVFNAVSDFSNDSSNEIANAIQSITGAQPTGTTQTELANALQQMRNEIETTSLTFKGYVATSAPSSSTYALVEGNLWINSATMPTSFPVAASSIKQWNGTSWVNYGSTYTPADFDFFRNINDNEGYYWFGGQWTVMSTDMSTTYFTLNQSTGKWEIKSNVNLPGAPTTTTANALDKSTKVATTQYVHDTGANYVSNCLTEIPQDITLTLESGTLTLKAGSKCYLKTDTTTPSVTVASDLTTTQTTDGTYFVIYDGSDLTTVLTTAYTYATLPDTYSLPLGVVTVSSGAISSIDNVFNGLGYIGSQVFTLPGVKGLYPDFRNTDGTLKNGTIECTTVQISSAFNDSGQHCLLLRTDGRCQWYFTNQFYYDSNNNVMYTTSGTKINVLDAGTFTTTAGVISNFKPKTPIRAVDYNDFSNLQETVAGKQDTLISGINIKTINGHNILGSGDEVLWVEDEHRLVTFIEPTADNNYVWVRKYADGWVEQGGAVSSTTTEASKIVSFPVAMRDTNYNLQVTMVSDTNSNAPTFYSVGARTKSATGFTCYAANNIIKDWMVTGMSATYTEYDYTTPGTHTLVLEPGTYLFKGSGAGGGGACALGGSLLYDAEAGASGGTGAYGEFIVTVSATDTFTVTIGAGGTGATKDNGTAASTNGTATSISSAALGTDFVVLGGGGAGYARADSSHQTATAGTAGTVTTTLTDHDLHDGSVGDVATTSSNQHYGYTTNPGEYASYGFGGGFSYHVSNGPKMSATNGGNGWIHIEQLA